MRTTRLIGWSIIFALPGCVHYAPAPVSVPELVQAADTASLDNPALRQRLSQLGIDDASNGKALDRLALLATAAFLNSSLAHARASAQTASANARAARVRPGPTLSLTAEYSAAAGGVSPWLVGIASDFLLDIGQRREGRILAAEGAAKLALYDYADRLWIVRMQLRRSLVDRLLAERERAIAAELTQLRARQFEATRYRLREGEASRPELERVRADAAAETQRLAAAEARSQAALVTLAKALGVAPQAIADRKLVWEGIADPTPIDDVQLQELRDPALLSRVDVLRAVLSYDQAENALKTAVAGQYPEIRLGPGYIWERGVSKQPFTLALVLPPMDLNEGAIAAAEAARAEAGRNLEAVVASAVSGVAAAASEYRAAWSALDLLRRETLPTARALAEQAEHELAAGSINRVDWVASQIGLLSAELDEIAAVGRVRTAEAAIEDALRCPLDGPEQAASSGGKWIGDSM